MDHTPQPGPPSHRLTAVVVGTVAATLVIAVTAWTLAPRASRAAGPGGPHLSIAVVPPIEPEPIAGDVMEVGTLNDAFDRAALEREAPEVIPADVMPPDAYVGEDVYSPQAEPASRPTPAALSDVAIVTSTNPLADGSRLFGFDRPPIAPPNRALVSDKPDAEPGAILSDPNVFQ